MDFELSADHPKVRVRAARVVLQVVAPRVRQVDCEQPYPEDCFDATVADFATVAGKTDLAARVRGIRVFIVEFTQCPFSDRT